MPEALSGRKALRDLLQGRSLYELETGRSNLAAFNADLVSLPASVARSPPIETLLDDEVSRYLEAYRELMLRPVNEKDEIELEVRRITPYTDRKLLSNKKAYHAFVKGLWGLGLLGATLRPKEKVGIFFARRSNRTKLRLIVDARRSNCWFKQPPGVRLCTAESFANIEAGEDGAELLEG